MALSPLLFFLSFPLLALSLNDEGLALLSFKSSIHTDPSNSLLSWNSSDPTPCSWNGVTCSSSSAAVVSVSIPNRSLAGTLSPSLFSLPSLRHINLRTNNLHGPLPSSIANLSNLQSLDLSHNSFNGSLPISLTKLKRLKAVDLSHNSFSRPLPVGLGSSLVQLQRLDLSHNVLSGSIPDDIGNLSSLQGTADFSHNSFSGSIPASLGNLPEKVYIDLSYNNLSGPIPQNGGLENRGPTAFVGNPLLCGLPMKNPCSSSSGAPVANPFLPANYPPFIENSSSRSSKGVSRIAVVAIVLCDVIGICSIASVFYYCYRRVVTSKEVEEGSKGGKECLCFTKEDSETLSEKVVEHLDLVPLDRQVGFDMDELLKASAFVLGKSGIGIVYKVVLEDGLMLAVRRLGEGGSQRFRELQTEVEAIGRVRHPNVVTLRAYYWSIDDKLLIYDYIPNGNLSSAIHGRAGVVSFQPLPWEVRLKIMRGIANGLAFLHEVSPKKYVHGDLKPDNILLGMKMEPYISDFGLGHLANIAGGSPLLQPNPMPSEKGHDEQSEVSINPAVTTAASSCYQAPEALKTLKPSQKWDVYSYGVILLELITGRSPVVLLETSNMDLVQWIQFFIKEKKPLADVLDPFLAEVLDNKEEEEEEEEIIAVLKIALACVQAIPERRPSMRHVVETLRW